MIKTVIALSVATGMTFAASGLGEKYDDMVKAANTKAKLEKVMYVEKVVTPKVEPKVKVVQETPAVEATTEVKVEETAPVAVKKEEPAH